jgi:hypothetical protein
MGINCAVSIKLDKMVNSAFGNIRVKTKTQEISDIAVCWVRSYASNL